MAKGDYVFQATEVAIPDAKSVMLSSRFPGGLVHIGDRARLLSRRSRRLGIGTAL